jgi:hypothetical protein
VPLAANLSQGELAINVTDKKLYTKDSGGNVILIASNGGDVTGPATATDNAIVRFDATTGRLIQNSVVTIADTTGNMAGVGTLTATTVNAALNGTLGATTPSTAVVTSLTDSGLTSGRVTYASTGGLLADSANLTWDSTALYTPNVILPQSAWTIGCASSTVDIVGYGSTGSGGTTNTLVFNTNASERMRINASGYVGIGTAAPNKILTINKNQDDGIRIRSADTNGSCLSFGIDTVVGITYIASSREGSGTYRPLSFYTNDLERMRLDTSGNLGLGVTPSAWGSGYKAIQSTNGASFGDMNGYTSVASNYFNNGSGDKYIANGYASRYLQSGIDGIHRWYTAPSGTAGNAITFTQAMTLHASGALSIGNTTDSGAYSVLAGNASYVNSVNFNALNSSGQTSFGVQSTTAYGALAAGDGFVYTTKHVVLVSDSASGAIKFATGAGAIERMRVASSGALFVGYTSGNSVTFIETPSISIGQTGTSSTTAKIRFAPAQSGYNVMGIYNSQSASGGGLVFTTDDSQTNSSNTKLMTLNANGSLNFNVAGADINTTPTSLPSSTSIGYSIITSLGEITFVENVTNLTLSSVSLPPGVWQITFVAQLIDAYGTLNATACACAITTNSAYAFPTATNAGFRPDHNVMYTAGSSIAAAGYRGRVMHTRTVTNTTGSNVTYYIRIGTDGNSSGTYGLKGELNAIKVY